MFLQYLWHTPYLIGRNLYGVVIIRVQFMTQNLYIYSCILHVHCSYYYALAITVFVTHHKQKDLLFQGNSVGLFSTRNLIIISIDLISFPIEMTSIFVSFLCFRYWWSRIIKEFRVNNNVRKHKTFSRWSKTTSYVASSNGIHTWRKLFVGFGKLTRW